MAINKVVRLGTIAPYSTNYRVSIFCKVQFPVYEGVLSITGVEGPHRGGNCSGRCGQIVMSYRSPEAIAAIKPANGWRYENIARFFALWDKHQLKPSLSADDLAFLASLPETDRKPAWI